jgi:hypothetical protein
LDASVPIDGDERIGLERFAPLRLATVCHGAAAPARPGSSALLLSQRRSARNHADLLLTPFELIDRTAALVPPPRRHWLRYFGALAPNFAMRNIGAPHAGECAGPQ